MDGLRTFVQSSCCWVTPSSKAQCATSVSRSMTLLRSRSRLGSNPLGRSGAERARAGQKRPSASCPLRQTFDGLDRASTQGLAGRACRGDNDNPGSLMEPTAETRMDKFLVLYRVPNSVIDEWMK